MLAPKWLGMLLSVRFQKVHLEQIKVILKVESHFVKRNQGKKHMPIAVEFAPSRSKKIAVDVVPAEWQLYIAH